MGRIHGNIVLVVLLVFCCGKTTSTVSDYPPELCNGCRIVNGKGYNYWPGNCNRFLHCVFDVNNNPFAYNVPCSPGTLWDQDKLICNYASEVTCPFDPCHDRSIVTYPAHGNCRGYWVCHNGQTYRYACCLPGYEYVENVGCIGNSACRIPCPPPKPIIDNRCGLGPHPEPTKFMVIVQDHPPYELDCPSGTEYNATACGCGTLVGAGKVWCMPEYIIDCYGSWDDKSMQNIKIGNLNHTVGLVYPPGATDGAACDFSGNGRLIIWRFANVALGFFLKVYIRFKEKFVNPPFAEEVLMSNADCGASPTFELTFNRLTQKVTVRIVTENGTFSASADYAPGHWKDVVVVYDGANIHQLALYVDSEQGGNNFGFSTAYGKIKRIQCALNIGYGEGRQSLNALVDEVKSLELSMAIQLPQPVRAARRHSYFRGHGHCDLDTNLDLHLEIHNGKIVASTPSV